MNRQSLAVCFVLFSLALTASVSNAQSRAVIDCFEARTFQYTGGKYNNAEIKYRLHTPKTIQYGQKYPLIIHLHGIGEAGSDNTRSLRYLDAVIPLMQQQDFFLLVTQCPDSERHWFFRPSTQDGTLDVLTAIMEDVIANNPINKNRITATGVSSGGWGVWELIMRHPDVFAGAVPTACGAPRQFQKLAALKRTPVWAIVNKEDAGIDINSSQMATVMVNRSGGSMAVTETNAPGHNAWTPAMQDYNCFQWMLAQKRGSWFAPPPGVVVHKAHSLLMVFVLYILPLSIIASLVFISWGSICESVQERFG